MLIKEEKAFRQTLRKGLQQLPKLASDGLTGESVFTLYDTYGFPVELSVEEAFKQDIKLSDNWRQEFDDKMAEQRAAKRRPKAPSRVVWAVKPCSTKNTTLRPT